MEVDMSLKMISSSKYFLLLAMIAAAIASFVPVFAGGWAVITLDELPAQVIAGEPLKIGFTVRQHGNHPMEDLTATISLRNSQTGEAFVVEVVPDAKPGHYSAELNFPDAGNWTWSIQAFTMDQPMPPLNVFAASSSEAAGTASQVSLPMIVGVMGLVAALGSLLVGFRRRTSWSIAAILAGVIVSATGFASASGRPVEVDFTTRTPPSQAEVGEALFIAKGCLTCHDHAKTNSIGEMHLGMGPDLTSYSADPEFLQSWLSNPPALKPSTEMPNLELNENEIEALIAFLITD
jgi:cytochrome c2